MTTSFKHQYDYHNTIIIIASQLIGKFVVLFSTRMSNNRTHFSEFDHFSTQSSPSLHSDERMTFF